MICRFCGQRDVHFCPGGELQPGDRAYELWHETRAFPGLLDAADHPRTVEVEILTELEAQEN